MFLREKSRPQIQDFLEDDPQVIAVDGFQALPVGLLVRRGDRFRLSDEVVRKFPEFFAVVIPVAELDGPGSGREIERGGDSDGE